MYDAELETALAATGIANAILADHYTNGVELISKTGEMSSADVVSIADQESETAITDLIRRNHPGHGFLGEEGATIEGDGEYRWHIDPLDGTYNFGHRIPLWGVSIGLCRNQRSVLGVLSFPSLHRLVYATAGGGAFEVALDQDGTPRLQTCRMIHVSDKSLAMATYYPAGKYRGKYGMSSRLMAAVRTARMLDASAFELAAIATGEGEIYAMKSVIHDVAAGVVIVREAGGTVTDQLGDEWTADSPTIVATNGIIHDEVLAILSKEDDWIHE